jgi:BASS family bile acid:Na+ symporter
MDIDLVRLNLNQSGMTVLKIIIALIMYGVALDLKISDFKALIKNPKGLAAGFIGQFLIFPLITMAIIYFTDVRPSIALGLVMVAACPSGNLANLVTSLAKGNVALAVGLTSSSTLLAMVTTPFLLFFLGEKIPGAAALLSEIHIGSGEMLEGVFILLGIPLILGMITAKMFPVFSQKFQKIMSKVSVAFLLLFVIGALAANYHHFLTYFHLILGVVFVLNVMVLLSGYFISKMMRLSDADARAVTIVMGIKNSALGLAMVFQFFQGMGGMAMIVAWWGISQITMGLVAVRIWKYLDLKKAAA